MSFPFDLEVDRLACVEGCHDVGRDADRVDQHSVRSLECVDHLRLQRFSNAIRSAELLDGRSS